MINVSFFFFKSCQYLEGQISAALVPGTLTSLWYVYIVFFFPTKLSSFGESCTLILQVHQFVKYIFF